MCESVYESQRKVIGRYLMSGKSITPIEALNLCGCFRLSAIIYVLKNDHNMDIRTEMVYDGRKRYAKYTLNQEN